MRPSQLLTDLTPGKRAVIGLAAIATGVLVAASVTLNPEKLQVPSWVALCASGSFVIAGIAIAIRGIVSEKIYDWIMVALVALLAAIPAWIALGPGTRVCTATVPFFAGELLCRVGFGLGGAILLGVLAIAILKAVKKTHAA